MVMDTEYRQKIEAEMHSALSNGEFQVYLQPKVNMITSKVYGAEALSRWIHPTEGMRRPDLYIPIFEENGFIVNLDTYMFEEICKLKARWREEGVEFASIPISFNMSKLQLTKTNVVKDLLEIAQKYDVDPFELDVEITEGMYLDDNSELTGIVTELQENGFSVSLDDFGSGYSALGMLRDIPVDTIKIDKSFLKLSDNNERGEKVVKNIIMLCKDLKFDVVVEGVETQEQIEFLTNYGCEIAQGFHYSKPVPIEDFEAYTKEHYVVSVDIVKFSFNGNYMSDDGRFEGEPIGGNWKFEKGIADSIRAIHFFGGLREENCISLPPSILHSDGYTVSMWLKVDRLITWSAAIFAEYENGFFQFCPLSERGESCFRIRDRRGLNRWNDSVTEPLEVDCWYHVVIKHDRRKSRASLYINAEEVGFCESVEAIYFPKRLLIGGDIYKECFEGSICEVIFYDRALRHEDIVELHECYTSMKDFDAF